MSTKSPSFMVYPVHRARRLAFIIALCLMASSLCTGCFVTARGSSESEVTVGTGFKF